MYSQNNPRKHDEEDEEIQIENDLNFAPILDESEIQFQKAK